MTMAEERGVKKKKKDLHKQPKLMAVGATCWRQLIGISIAKVQYLVSKQSLHHAMQILKEVGNIFHHMEQVSSIVSKTILSQSSQQIQQLWRTAVHRGTAAALGTKRLSGSH